MRRGISWDSLNRTRTPLWPLTVGNRVRGILEGSWGLGEPLNHKPSWGLWVWGVQAPGLCGALGLWGSRFRV